MGIALLVLTFYIAINVFLNPGTLKGFTELVPDIEHIDFGSENEAELEGAFESLLKMMSYGIAALLLWVMGSIGGRITKHGVDMYKS